MTVDSHGAQTIATMIVDVGSQYARAAARVNVGLDTWPQVTNVAVAPAQLAYPTTASVTATAQDANSDTGSIAVDVGTPQAFGLAPTIVATAQSETETGPTGTVSFAVEAKDPEGTGLTFAWTCTLGTIAPGTATINASGSTTSRTQWTASMSGGRGTVTVVVRDAAGQETARAFSVSSPVPDQAVLGGQEIGWMLPISQRVGISHDGELVGVEFSLFRNQPMVLAPGNSVVLTIHQATATSRNSPLAQASVLTSSLPLAPSAAALSAQSISAGYFALGQPLAVTSGMQLYFVLSYRSEYLGEACPKSDGEILCCKDGADHWIEPVQAGSAPSSLPEGGIGYINAWPPVPASPGNQDLAFRTFIR
jgi:hypothetical protein